MIKNKKSSSLVDSIWIRETEFWHYWVWFLKTNLNPDRTDHHDKNADSALKQLKWAWGDLVTACMNLDESHDPDLRKLSMLTDFLFKCNLIVDRQCGFVRSCIYPNSPPICSWVTCLLTPTSASPKRANSSWAPLIQPLLQPRPPAQTPPPSWPMAHIHPSIRLHPLLTICRSGSLLQPR